MKRKIISLSLSVLLLGGLTSCGSSTDSGMNSSDNTSTTESSTSTDSDSVKMAKAYDISEENPFVYTTAKKAIDIIKSGTGAVVFGFEDCPWCRRAIPVLNDAAKESNIEKVYYVNIRKDRDDNTSEYQQIVKLLGENLKNDENGKPRIYTPDVYFIKEGKILAHHMDLTADYGEDISVEMTDKQKDDLKKIYQELFELVYPK